MPLDADLCATVQQWVNKDPETAHWEHLKALLRSQDEAKLRQIFASRLAFGTAGLRGLMGPGPGNMNRLVVREATAGLAIYLLQSPPVCREQSVVVAYDGRHDSKLFAADAAGVLAAHGLRVRLYDCEAPTPLGAYAVKTLGTAAGIVVTASHNPPDYNGYKVYQAGGCQINTPVDAHIAACIDRVAKELYSPKCLSLQEAEKKGLLTYLDNSMFGRYVNEVINYFPLDATSAKQRSDLRIAYTALHGVGTPVAEAIFLRAGFTFESVEQQREPDPNFSTVKFPNPEEEGAMDLVHKLADSQYQAHICIANDPDADRLSVSARTQDGRIEQLTGDQIGAILGDELMRRGKSTAAKNWSLSTIVSSRLLARLARIDGSHHRETLTGFKWLGTEAKKLEEQGQRFIFAYEEALGYMVTNAVLDKDGLSALLLLSLLAAELHANGATLWTRLEEIHRRAGLSVTYPRTIRLSPGQSGDKLMQRLRANMPTSIGGQPIAYVEDLLQNPAQPVKEGDIPKNDVLRFYVCSAAGMSKEQIILTLPRICLRPSGTEPKVKCYCESRIDVLQQGEGYEAKLKQLEEEIVALADAFVKLCQ